MIWGHRNDPQGFVESLREFDMELPRLLAALRHGDLLVITSDHGCDPTTASTDHSREHALLLAPSPAGRPRPAATTATPSPTSAPPSSATSPVLTTATCRERPPMKPIKQLIARKRDGGELAADEIAALIEPAVRRGPAGRVSDGRRLRG